MTKLRGTVIKKFSPEDVFRQNHGITYNGAPIPACGLEEGEEFTVEDYRFRPEGFCGRA